MNLSCVIKTFERPKICQRLIDSIRKFYSDIPIIVADDSMNPTTYDGAQTYWMAFDSGLSAGRNFLVQKAETEYVVILDDDWIFTEGTKLEEFVRILTSSDLDILAGLIRDQRKDRIKQFYGSISCIPPLLVTSAIPYEGGDFTRCDFTHNFFIAARETLVRFRWDEDLKLSEHLEFFIRVQGYLSVGYTNRVLIDERSFRGGDYGKFRSRNFFADAMKKHGISRFVNHRGEVHEF